MEILAGLVRLEIPNTLPAPWYNRPSLGLVTNTDVSIGVAKSNDGSSAPPDIIVTPLRIDRLQCTASITIDLDEKLGAVSSILEKVGSNFNIALSETITVDQRTKHRITLIAEPTNFDPTMDTGYVSDFQAKLDQLKESIEEIEEVKDVDVKYVSDITTLFERQDTSTVVNGRIYCLAIFNWYKEQYHSRFGDFYDFDRVVVSSSADDRFIRYVFPKRGVFQATISHRDTPTALWQATNVLQNLGYNILLSRLSRSIGPELAHGKSIFVAICEPQSAPTHETLDSSYTQDVAKSITNKLNECLPTYQFNLQGNRVSLGSSIAKIAYPYRQRNSPEIREIKAQEELEPFFKNYRSHTGKNSVFLSYRSFLNSDAKYANVKNCIISGIIGTETVVYDGFSEPSPLHNDEVGDLRARLWLASAGIFFAIHDKEGNGNLTSNQLIEWGFTYAQGKPWMVIVKEEQINEVKRNFLIPDRSFVTFNTLDTQNEIDELCNKVRERILSWFNK